MASELAALAVRQLEAWENVAREWPLNVVKREDGSFHLVCCVCDMGLIPVIYVTGTSYTITHNITIAATVAHLRNIHRLIESEVYQDGRQDAKAVDSNRDSSASNRGAFDSYRL